MGIGEITGSRVRGGWVGGLWGRETETASPSPSVTPVLFLDPWRWGKGAATAYSSDGRGDIKQRRRMRDVCAERC
jgi:hypothetical protein